MRAWNTGRAKSTKHSTSLLRSCSEGHLLSVGGWGMKKSTVDIAEIDVKAHVVRRYFDRENL